jgi:SAM-dependent methyltransferase
MTDPARARFLDALRGLSAAEFVRLTLGAPVGDDPTLRSVHARPVALRGGVQVQVVWRHERRDVTKNFPMEAFVAQMESLLGPSFRSAHLFAVEASWQLTLRPNKPGKLSQGPGAGPADPRHDREKRRTVSAEAPWLHALGVTTADGTVTKGMEGKYRQIHRFVELLSHFLADAPRGGPLRVLDLGCGKGYLTFAAWSWLRSSGWPEATVTGVELRPDLAARVEAVARRLGCDGLTVRAGAIADADLPAADLVIALHACDTATDDALAHGVRVGARWMVVAPCCHRELRPQLEAPPAMAALLAHGILRERESELVTDALRAAVLEAVGYRARVFEFVASEHTAKNLMVTAEFIGGETDRTRPAALAAAWGVAHQRLAQAVGVSLAPAPV